jgi:hypothetical protein
MTTHVSATWTGGIFKPDEELPLADETRVRLTIEPIENWSPTASLNAWEAIKAGIEKKPLHFGGQRFTRDELHERR